MQWTRLQDALLDLLFPPKCAVCGHRGRLLCATCLAGMDRISPPLCPKCGRPQTRRRLCRVCRETQPTIDGIRAVAYFEGGLRRAIHRFKYQGARRLGHALAQLLVEYQNDHTLPADVIVPVPLHAERRTERGYNQAEILAVALGTEVDVPVDAGALARARATAPQIHLDAIERRANVADAFRADEERIAQRRVLLIDDVCTTGATMESCTQALKLAGAKSVWGLALARGR